MVAGTFSLRKTKTKNMRGDKIEMVHSVVTFKNT